MGRKTADTTRKAARQAATAKPVVTVVVVDDHPVVRQGVQMLIDAQKDMSVCGTAESVNEGLAVIKEHDPDVAVVDISLKDSNGLELIKDLQIRQPGVRVLVLSMHDETFFAERVLRAGARGYITKEETTTKVVEGIRAIMEGEVFLSESMSSKMLLKMVGGKAQSMTTSIEALTDRELEVYEMIGHGLGTREIAEKLHLSPKTIETYRERIKDKLQLESATELLRHAVQWVQCDTG